MDDSGKRWTVQDRDGNPIYLTEERWGHIVANHPEVEPYEDQLRTTIQRGKRRQEPLNQRKYRYAMSFRDLPESFNHIVVIVLFGFVVDVHGESQPNNWVATAFLKHIRIQDRQ
jgi:hypothetical protein